MTTHTSQRRSLRDKICTCTPRTTQPAFSASPHGSGSVFSSPWLLMDFVLYTQMNLPIAQNPPLQQGAPGQQFSLRSPPLPINLTCREIHSDPFIFSTPPADWLRLPFLSLPTGIGYKKNWDSAFYPLLLLTISTAPIFINVFDHAALSKWSAGKCRGHGASSTARVICRAGARGMGI